MVELRGHRVVLPSPRDPRIHLSLVTIGIFVIGIGWLNFRVSIAQILVALAACAVVDLALSFRKTGMIIWPASALQTASSTALLLRVEGTPDDDLWSLHGWYYFVGIALFGLLTKLVFRRVGGHVFNPSNIALVLAFLLFGSNRIEPLDLWWGPLDPPMAAAFIIIIGGGLLIGRQLGLIAMGVAFWMTLAVLLGLLTAVDHSITARWALGPITGSHFWWVVMTSPEILIFLFFMITDPKTVPAGRVARVVFGVVVACLGVLLASPWQTEFGFKVGLLTGLTIACVTRPIIERWLPAAKSVTDDPRRWARSLLVGSAARADARRFLRSAGIGATAIVVLGSAIMVAGVRSTAASNDTVVQPGIIAKTDPATLPRVTVADDIAALSATLATQTGAQDLAAELAFNLEVEREAMRTRDASLLSAIAHGARLEHTQRLIDDLDPASNVVASAYAFHALHLVVVFPGGAQRGANAGLVVDATRSDITYSPQGVELDRSEHPVQLTFALRRTTNGHWQITDTLTPPTDGATS
jgi:Na+-translocating ferredoxin:NAD+ oxidoreductase RnfD subunit